MTAKSDKEDIRKVSEINRFWEKVPGGQEYKITEEGKAFLKFFNLKKIEKEIAGKSGTNFTQAVNNFVVGGKRPVRKRLNRKMTEIFVDSFEDVEALFNQFMREAREARQDLNEEDEKLK